MLWGIFLRIKLGPEAQDILMAEAKSIGVWNLLWISFNWGIFASLVAGIIGWVAHSSLIMAIVGSCLSFTVGAYMQIQI